MPIYEYKCEMCGQVFSQLMMSSTAEPKCPGCGSTKARKLISSFSCSSSAGSSGGGFPMGGMPSGGG